MPVFMTTDGDREFDRFNSPGIIYTQTHNTNIACSGSGAGSGGSGGSGGGITNPFNGTLQVTDLETSDTFSLNDDLGRIRNITSATEAPEVTTMTGSLVIPNIKSAGGNCQVDINDTDIQVVSASGDIQLNGNSITLSGPSLTYNGHNLVTDQGGSNLDTTLTTTQTTFTNPNELVTKAYVDNVEQLILDREYPSNASFTGLPFASYYYVPGPDGLYRSIGQMYYSTHGQQFKLTQNIYLTSFKINNYCFDTWTDTQMALYTTSGSILRGPVTITKNTGGPDDWSVIEVDPILLQGNASYVLAHYVKSGMWERRLKEPSLNPVISQISSRSKPYSSHQPELVFPSAIDYTSPLDANRYGFYASSFDFMTEAEYASVDYVNLKTHSVEPLSHDKYSLGSTENRWNEIHAKTGYFAQQTIYLGDKWKLSVDETHPTNSSIKLSHASQGHDSGVIDNEVVLANPTQTGMVVNHSNLSGDTAKASNLTSGIVEDYTAKVSILEGQPVALDIDSDIKVTTITSSTPAWQIVGVATNACNAGDIVEVCTKGFCNVRRVTTYESPTLKLLNSSTNNTTPVGLAWTFKDSGNDSNYSSNENYKITFDAQAGGTWTLTFNSFEFEHSTSSMYDRLGIQTSSDGVTFTNASISWMQKSATSTVPWSSSFAGSSWNSTSSKNGYIVPENTTRAILLGWDQQPLTINDRYIRFTFFSDSSSNDPGWNITLVSSNYGAGNATVLPYGSPLYLDTSGSGDYTTVSTTGANIIAYSASADSSNDSIYSYIP